MNILVAGIGNMFMGDDGFGPEVIRQMLAEGPPPPQVRVVDYGIRGMFLAHDLLGVDRLILVDALPAEETPGELVVLEIGPDDIEPAEFDAHAMSPGIVLGAVRRLGEELPKTYLVGCRIDTTFDVMGLTPRVRRAVPEAIAAVRTLIDRCLAEAPGEGPDLTRFSPVAQLFRDTAAEPKGPLLPFTVESSPEGGGV